LGDENTQHRVSSDFFIFLLTDLHFFVGVNYIQPNMNHSTLVIGLLCVWLLTGCRDQSERVLRIDGSSTLFPLAEAISESYSRTYPDRKVVVGLSGTGGGFRKLSRGEIDICMASRPLGSGDPQELTEELRSGRLREVAVARDAVVVAVHPLNPWVDAIDSVSLARIWHSDRQGKPAYWSELNPDAPRVPINLYGPGPGSGTFDFFTRQILGQAGHGRGDYSANEIDAMTVAGIAGDRLALGYFGYTYYLNNRNRVKALGIEVPTALGGGFALPSAENVDNGRYQLLSRYQYLYVRSDDPSKAHIDAYVRFFLMNLSSQRLVGSYLPLKQEMHRDQLQYWSINESKQP
jgi:phosphate transport system substrate-binding protein